MIELGITRIFLGDGKLKPKIDLLTDLKQNKMTIQTQKPTDKAHDIIIIDGILFQFEGTALSVMIENLEYWFRAKEVGKCLGYANTRIAISYNVDKKEIRKYASFQEAKNLRLKGNQKNTLYISSVALNKLVLESKTEQAKKFKAWVAILLDKINKGEQIQKSIKANISNYTIEPCLEYKDWALTNSTIELKGENIFYIGIIGKFTSISSEWASNVAVNETIFKYGISDDECRRDKEHKAEYEYFTCFYLITLSKFNRLEKDFESELKRKGLLRHHKFNGKKTVDQELFVLDNNFTIDDVKIFVDNWIYKFDTKFDELHIEREKTKQEQLKLLQKEKDIEIKKIELEILKLQYDMK